MKLHIDFRRDASTGLIHVEVKNPRRPSAWRFRTSSRKLAAETVQDVLRHELNIWVSKRKPVGPTPAAKTTRGK